MKGQAATFNYPLIARVAGSLSRLIHDLPPSSRTSAGAGGCACQRHSRDLSRQGDGHVQQRGAGAVAKNWKRAWPRCWQLGRRNLKPVPHRRQTDRAGPIPGTATACREPKKLDRLPVHHPRQQGLDIRVHRAAAAVALATTGLAPPAGAAGHGRCGARLLHRPVIDFAHAFGAAVGMKEHVAIGVGGLRGRVAPRWLAGALWLVRISLQAASAPRKCAA